MSSSTAAAAVVSDAASAASVVAAKHQDKAAINGIHGTPTGWKYTWVKRIALRAGVASLSTAAAEFLHEEHLKDIKDLTHGAAALRTIGAHKTNRVTAKHVRAYLRMKNREILGGPVLVSASAKAAAKKSREDKPFKVVTEGGVTYVPLSYFVAGAPGTYDALNYGSFAKTDTYSSYNLFKSFASPEDKKLGVYSIRKAVKMSDDEIKTLRVSRLHETKEKRDAQKQRMKDMHAARAAKRALRQAEKAVDVAAQ